MLSKYIYPFGLFLILVIFGTSFYLQYYDGFEPCPLCMLQRFAFGLLGVLFFLGIFIGRLPFFRRLIPFLSLISATLGGILAGRQVYLQQYSHGPHESCGVSLQYMLHVLPLNEAFEKIFAGSAECTKKGFQFLLLNMAEWSFVMFVGFGVLALYLLFRKHVSDNRYR